MVVALADAGETRIGGHTTATRLNMKSVLVLYLVMVVVCASEAAQHLN